MDGYKLSSKYWIKTEYKWSARKIKLFSSIIFILHINIYTDTDFKWNNNFSDNAMKIVVTEKFEEIPIITS